MLSAFQFLSRPAPFDAAAGGRATLEPIRRAMLHSLGAEGERHHAPLAHRIRYALDAQRLWYLRSELMAALASLHGEQHAARALERISFLFRDVLPKGLAAGLERRGPAARLSSIDNA